MVICDVVFNYVPLFPLGELTRCYLDIHYFTFPPILRRLLCRSTHTHRLLFYPYIKTHTIVMIINHKISL